MKRIYETAFDIASGMSYMHQRKPLMPTFPALDVTICVTLLHVMPLVWRQAALPVHRTGSA